jgi:hypothetical protein
VKLIEINIFNPYAESTNHVLTPLTKTLPLPLLNGTWQRDAFLIYETALRNSLTKILTIWFFAFVFAEIFVFENKLRVCSVLTFPKQRKIPLYSKVVRNVIVEVIEVGGAGDPFKCKLITIYLAVFIDH